MSHSFQPCFHSLKRLKKSIYDAERTHNAQQQQIPGQTSYWQVFDFFAEHGTGISKMVN